MSILKIGGKGDNGNLIPFGVSNKGYGKITRLWNTTVTEIFNDTLTGTEIKSTLENVFNCEEYGFLSIRFANATGCDLEATLYSDIGSSTLSNYLYDNNGDAITFPIPKGQSILTPEELPFLNYLRFLKFNIKPLGVPDGKLSIQVYAKR